MRSNYLRKQMVEKLKHTFYVQYFFFFRKSGRFLDNVEKYDTAGQAVHDNTIWCMRFAWWITRVTDTHTEYVILIAFQRQQWLCERTSMLH
jgi:hypothetical protein